MADFSITGEVKLNSDPAEKAASKWTVAAGQMIADFAKQAASSLQSVVKTGIDYNAQMQSYLTNFTVMLGDEQLAAAKLEEIRKMAASTPFSLSDLTSGTQTLLQFGIAADDTTNVLKMLGDISLGNADKLQTLVRAYGKMSSAQKVTLENVNMMIDAGFNPLNQICAATGESMSDLYKRISDGKVGFDELAAAVNAATSQGGQFYNGMLEASQTFNGRVSTLTDNLKALVGELTDGLFSALGQGVVKVNELVVSFLDSDEKMAQLKETVGLLAAAVVAAGTAVLTYKGYLAAASAATALHTTVTTAMTAAQKAAETGATGLKLAQAALNATISANPVGLFAAALAGLAAGLVTAYKTSETFRNTVNSAFNSVKRIAQDVIGAVVDWVNELVAKIQGAAAALGSLKNGLGAAKAAYAEAYNGYMDSYNQQKQDKAAERRRKLHEERVKQAQEEAAAASAAADTIVQADTRTVTSAQKKAKTTKAASATVVESFSNTTKTVEGQMTRTVETVNEVLSNGQKQQRQIITESGKELVDGVQKTVKTVTTIGADGKKSVQQTMEDVEATVKETVTATTSALVKGVQTTTQTVTETLTDGTTKQKRVITETYDAVVDGALVTIERAKTIAADGTEQVAEQIKESAADSFSGLWKELQEKANEGVLGTFSDLYTAVKNKDWAAIGQWTAATLYNGLTADQKQQVERFALGLVEKLNGALGDVQSQLAEAAWNLGSQICSGVTSGFADILTRTRELGSTLSGILGGLKEPLGNAALALSQGLQGGLISTFPSIYAAMGTLLTSIGGAFQGMLTAIGTALSSTGIGLPVGLAIAGAAVALGVTIAALVRKLRGTSGGSSTTGSPGSTSTPSDPGSSGSSGGSTPGVPITGTDDLEQALRDNTAALAKTNAALADMVRQAGSLVLSDNRRTASTVAASGTARIAAAAGNYTRQGDTTVNQYIYSKAQTAADLARETRWEADRAKGTRH